MKCSLLTAFATKHCLCNFHAGESDLWSAYIFIQVRPPSLGRSAGALKKLHMKRTLLEQQPRQCR